MTRLVLQITTVPDTAVAFLLPLAKRLRKVGWKVLFVSSDGPKVVNLESEGFAHIAVPMSRKVISPANLVGLHHLRQIMDAVKPTVVHCHTPVASFLARMALGNLRERPRVVYTVHGLPGLGSALTRRIYRFAEAQLRGRTDVYVALTEGLKQKLVREWGVSEADVHVQGVGGTGVDTGAFAPPSAMDRIEARIRFLGRDDESFVIGYVGRFVKEKGLLDLARAAHRLAQYGRFQLLCVGGVVGGDRNPVLPDTMERTAWPTPCTFVDFTPRPWEPMRAMDCLVLPSYREGFGLVLAEAQAMGIPVISSDHEGARYALIEGETGAIFHAGRVEELVSRILDLQRQVNYNRVEMSRRAVHLARERFAQDKVLRLYESIYDRLVS